MNNYRIYVGDKSQKPEDLIEFLSKISGPNYYDALVVKRALFESEPSFETKNIISARSEDGELVGVVRIVDREILVDGVKLCTGFITSVSVHPDWREKGIASALVNKSIQVMMERDYDLSTVHGRRAVDGFYPKFGYCNVGRYLDLEVISDLKKTSTLKIAPFQDTGLEYIMNSYVRTYHSLTGSICRTHGVWRFLLRKAETSRGAYRILRLSDANGLCGYIVTIGDALIEASISAEKLSEALDLVIQLGIQRFNLHPLHPLFLLCRKRFNTVAHERFALDGGYMARIINREHLLKKIGKLLAWRACRLNMKSKSIRLLGYRVDLMTGEVEENDGPSDICFESEESAVQILLGFMDPNHIHGVRWTESFDSVIEFLFPDRSYHTSTWDEV